ncbi:MAG: DUF2256 domain-containing protein [Candidatus Competibacterales bacterium]
MAQKPPDKVCPVCGRPFAWRKKWARDWDEVIYCSKACRRGLGAEDRLSEQRIRQALAAVPKGAVLALAALGDDGDQVLRRAARRLAACGEVEMLQGGRPVEPATAKGPLQLRRR